MPFFSHSLFTGSHIHCEYPEPGNKGKLLTFRLRINSYGYNLKMTSFTSRSYSTALFNFGSVVSSTLAFRFIPTGYKHKTCNQNRGYLWPDGIVLFLSSPQATLNLIIEDLLFWYFRQISPNQLANKIQAVFSHLSIFTQLTVIASLFRGSCWTSYCLVCKWHHWAAHSPLCSISCWGTFRCIWYSNFMNCISPISFIFDRYVSPLITVYLGNSYPFYISLCPCLPFYFPSLEFNAELR